MVSDATKKAAGGHRARGDNGIGPSQLDNPSTAAGAGKARMSGEKHGPGPAEEAGVGDLAALDVLEVPLPRWMPRFRIVRSSGMTDLLRSTVVISSEVVGALRVLSRALVALTTRSRWTPNCPPPCWACGSSALEGPPEPPKINPESSEGQESPEAIPWGSMGIGTQTDYG